MSQQSNRFKSLPWASSEVHVVVGGAGGIGSWLSVFLSRMGAGVTIIDPDVVEAHNLGGQLYLNEHIGMPKAESVKALCSVLNDGAHLTSYKTHIDDSREFTDEEAEDTELVFAYEFGREAFFSCFDNITARKQCFYAWLEANETDSSIFIDGRMLAEGGFVYAVRRNDEDAITAYEGTLFESGTATEQPCTAKATSHCGALIAAVMTSVFTNHLTNLALGRDIREVPFKTEVQLPLMLFDVHIKPQEDDKLL